MSNTGPARSDRDFLRDDQYSDERNLEARRSIYRHTVDGSDFITPAIEALRDAKSVLDVGCGPGVWHGLLNDAIPDCRWVGVDFSTGMVAAAAESGHVPVGVADAIALPISDSAVDAALSVHMLYHVPAAEQHAALSELARVVKPGGPVVVSTNAPDHLRELDELLVAAGHDTGFELPRLGSSLSFLFDDDGEQVMADAFGTVEIVHARGRLEIPDADVVARYIGSLGSIPELGPDGPGHNDMSDLVAAARQRAQTVIENQGSFEVHTHAGVFIAHAP